MEQNVRTIFTVKTLIVVILSSIVLGRIFPATMEFGDKLSVIETRHFDIIYPERSSNSALFLSTFADGLFEQVTTLLRYTNRERIPVAITPDYELFNSYCNKFPYTHIVLYDTPADPEWTTFRENFRNVFLHEMTHAISLNIYPRDFDWLSYLFPWSSPAMVMPEFMIEGIAVSMESRDGFGRANDPQFREAVMQDILENRYKTIEQATGAYSDYPYGNVFYEYGGIFNKFLQDEYGMEKYARFWDYVQGYMDWLKTGSNVILREPADDSSLASFNFDFELVYGFSMEHAWALFRNRLAPGTIGVLENTNTLGMPRDYLCRVKYREPMQILSPVLRNGGIYFIDSYNENVYRYDIASNSYEAVLEVDYASESLDVSSDGKRLLLSGYTYFNGLYRKKVREFDLADRHAIREYTNLSFARFFRDGVVGIRSREHLGDLVFLSGDRQEVLFTGAENVSCAAPVAMDSNRLAFIFVEDGGKRVGIFHYDTKTVEAVSAVEPSWNVRSLGAFGDSLLCSYNDDYTFYRPAVIRDGVVSSETNRYSGGVFHPMTDGTNVFYVGMFSRGDYLMRYPCAWTNFGVTNRESALENWRPTNAVNAPVSTDFPRSSYFGLKYFNPLDFWYPDFTMGYGRSNNYEIDSYGVTVMMGDPVDENEVSVSLTYNPDFAFVDGSVSWQDTHLPVNLSLAAGDQVVYTGTGGISNTVTNGVTNTVTNDFTRLLPLAGRHYRETSASMGLGWSLNFLPLYYSFSLGASAELIFVAQDPLDGTSAYHWTYSSTPSFVCSASADFSGMHSTSRFMDNRGFDIWTAVDEDLLNSEWKTEEGLTLGFEFLAHVLFSMNAAYSPEAIMSPSAWNAVFGSFRYPVYSEFSSTNLHSCYYLYGDLQLAGNRAILQTGWSWLYLNQMFFTAGYRFAYLADTYLNSAYVRLNLTGSLPISMIADYHPTFFLEANMRLNDVLKSSFNPQNEIGWQIGVSL